MELVQSGIAELKHPSTMAIESLAFWEQHYDVIKKCHYIKFTNLYVTEDTWVDGSIQTYYNFTIIINGVVSARVDCRVNKSDFEYIEVYNEVVGISEKLKFYKLVSYVDTSVQLATKLPTISEPIPHDDSNPNITLNIQCRFDNAGNSGNTNINKGSCVITIPMSKAISAGVCYIENNDSYDKYACLIDNGTEFERFAPCIDSGGNWNLY